MGRRPKDCYGKLRVNKKRIMTEIRKNELLLYNWRKHKHEFTPEHQKEKEYEIDALKKYLVWLSIVYDALDEPIKHNFDNVTYLNCLRNIKNAIKQANLYIMIINRDLDNWRTEKHGKSKNEILKKSKDLQRKLELEKYLQETVKRLSRDTIKDESNY
ncbi:MAG: hypothetical protein FGO69_10745 [Methanobacterium sp.]|jgi:hypothetical protein|nr:MAG: hypothetical protein FGO69_10745 [Methanobacterium sp.]